MSPSSDNVPFYHLSFSVFRTNIAIFSTFSTLPHVFYNSSYQVVITYLDSSQPDNYCRNHKHNNNNNLKTLCKTDFLGKYLSQIVIFED